MSILKKKKGEKDGKRLSAVQLRATASLICLLLTDRIQLHRVVDDVASEQREQKKEKMEKRDNEKRTPLDKVHLLRRTPLLVG